MLRATYSPDDNKLRLYPDEDRLPQAVYQRVTDAGFSWAPMQKLFVAPMWTPEREDLLIELCGEVEDDDVSLVERATERAERFEDHAENRASDASAAHARVRSIADHIPFGQPILVGHHSEKRARRDAERIGNGMRAAIRLWDTSGYWSRRAKAAIAAARYKETPPVRARRIKRIEADLRKQQKHAKDTRDMIALWSKCQSASDPEKQHAFAIKIANYDRISRAFPLALFPRQAPASQYEGVMSLYSALDSGVVTAPQACTIALDEHNAYLARCERWIQHYENRLAYERAMLEQSGGLETDKVVPEPGGACRCWCSPRNGYSYIQKVNRVSVTVSEKPTYGDRTYARTMPFDKLSNILSKAQVDALRASGRLAEVELGSGFILLDTSALPLHAPASPAAPDAPDAPTASAPPASAPEPDLAADIQAMRQTVAAGVRAIAVPSLVPTPSAVSERAVARLSLAPGQLVLEPSAGTGALLAAIYAACPTAIVHAVEINAALARDLVSRFPAFVLNCSFLDLHPFDLGCFDAIVMNPPFESRADARHVRHALDFLKPGGQLVAIVSAGTVHGSDPAAADFKAWLAEVSGTVTDLPADAFADSGVNVRTALVEIQRAAAAPAALAAPQQAQLF